VPRLMSAVVLALAVLAAGCSDDQPDTAPPSTTAPTTLPSTTLPSTTLPSTTLPSTTVPPTTVPAAPSASASDLCAITPPATEPVVVESGLLTEVSGIAFSRQHDNVVWAHNDSGGSARLHALDADTGADLGAWALSGAAAFDWEDMALVEGPFGVQHLYAADFGDNFRLRSDIRIYRAVEPANLSVSEALPTNEFIFTYPGGAADAESFFVDPATGDFIVITKTSDGTPATIYRGPADTQPETSTPMEKVGEVDLDGLSPSATAADITGDGSVIGIRTYAEVLLWDRAPGQTIGEALAGESCLAPSTAERQGEALTFLPDGSGYVTISEGDNPPVHWFKAAE